MIEPFKGVLQHETTYSYYSVCPNCLYSGECKFCGPISAGDKTTPNKVNIPPSVLNIAKENTYPNSTQDLPMSAALE